jgi:hypothetical protein
VALEDADRQALQRQRAGSRQAGDTRADYRCVDVFHIARLKPRAPPRSAEASRSSSLD